MRTEHRTIFAPAQLMESVKDGSVHLTVTSQPYPMVDMWDGIFASQNAEVGDALTREDDDGIALVLCQCAEPFL